MLDFNDEVVEIDIGRYLVSRLYVIVIIIGEMVYKLLFESFKKLLTRLQRGDAFIQSKISKFRGGRFINVGKNTRKNPRNSIL